MSTAATVKIEDRNTGQVRRLWVAHNGESLAPSIARALNTGATVDEVITALRSVVATDVYRGKVPAPACIQELTREQSVDAYADYRYRVIVPVEASLSCPGGLPAIVISSEDLV